MSADGLSIGRSALVLISEAASLDEAHMLANTALDEIERAKLSMQTATLAEQAHVERRNTRRRSRYDIRCDADGCLIYDLDTDAEASRRMPLDKAVRLFVEMNHAGR